MKIPLLYSIIRYAPYAETEEFANVGVVICSPKTNELHFSLTKSNDARIQNFFRDDSIFKVVKPLIENELNVASDIASNFNSAEGLRDFFFNLTEKRESIFCYSPVRVLMAHNANEELDRLYSKFIKQTGNTKERREDILAAELRHRFQVHSELKGAFKKIRLGGELTSFEMPLVAETSAKEILCAIKPLAFNQIEPSKMLEHCDKWVARIRRAVDEKILTFNNVLFTIDHKVKLKTPESKAIDEIRYTLDKYKITHFEAKDKDSAIKFAKQKLA
ncbi:DUF3037 domain-containing protein [Proteus mirabilis]|uniref:DUF3037 domain-containing protein n=1 Tax=Proteus columbae TaxID=1987580 RepID=A0A6I7D6P3_9GAMM|nr:MULTISPECIES: DUF3037 domain-containing protein [Proteus]EKW0400317.1 DUF3037 domain-containing protein [Proteus mirabilis]EKW4512169.1 DUF3037 domain-containing protein [Proteus mirabilis]MBG2802713.1 DUF3037 domain-containing protein [Proteus mirabilis]MBI6217500.1 DUF3037 domain-containing protein [Proteus vulgaris]MBI6530462.1 DUF3037 domain-containing protein [Proteus vulgaris]